ncbi:Cof-type HAD-IIB family hydrolase [Companilactobacillus halodurans]|uniref:HAD family hydrolase n=1 Tax=Companilactobacillus halodurans TaxID=2584183 RepID=A0A5P0ZPD4_9LACO|nr:Cof-type HAD-IIB family hydrolase [Companilactobacillus halodurans]MQS76110.1 HAD family hydrolase [Companilactobacillus halodurans]MQS96546.1 HAD family hydrolase [Companilactobacillus halodurans]
MAIKLVAFDMDGTFLNDKNTYNHQRFGKILEQLRSKNIRVVAASGSQYQRLQNQFDEFKSEMDFVSQNGAVVYSENAPLLIQAIPEDAVAKTLDIINHQFEPTDIAEHLVVGVKSAYVDQTISQAAYDLTYRYYNHLKRVVDLPTVTAKRLEDKITSIGVTFNNHVDFDSMMNNLRKALPVGLASQTSGYNTELISDNTVNKAVGLKELQKKFNVADDEIMTFGDNENDLGMLQLTPYGYAMENAVSKVKDAVNHFTDSNNDEGVLNVLEKLLK